MKNIVLLIFISSFLFSAKAQQDSQFTQYLFNGIHINPAYTGYKGDIYIQSFYRSQWDGVKGAPKSFSVAADGAFNDGNVGLGLIISNDQLGIRIGYSYDYSLNRLRDYNSGSHEISAGFYINRKNSRRNRQLRCYDF